MFWARYSGGHNDIPFPLLISFFPVLPQQLQQRPYLQVPRSPFYHPASLPQIPAHHLPRDPLFKPHLHQVHHYPIYQLIIALLLLMLQFPIYRLQGELNACVKLGAQFVSG